LPHTPRWRTPEPPQGARLLLVRTSTKIASKFGKKRHCTRGKGNEVPEETRSRGGVMMRSFALLGRDGVHSLVRTERIKKGECGKRGQKATISKKPTF